MAQPTTKFGAAVGEEQEDGSAAIEVERGRSVPWMELGSWARALPSFSRWLGSWSSGLGASSPVAVEARVGSGRGAARRSG
ncbi:hypothetical protein E2562_003813 [Oryza meyeriana var. granulata]|uniref:DUF834 domain-containing protein n=1 Tax=Oryza meyeriana var. granulata TaxID=110450 RepID=A0A6G1BSA2_9ORYZ|nr:hypothetical protein E2562_003813 [Oryza meyeriana var. granulata]